MTPTLLKVKVACKCAHREDRRTFAGLDASGLEINCQPSPAVRGFNDSINHNRMIDTDDGTSNCFSKNLLFEEAEFLVGRSSSAGVGSVRIHPER